jgi:putative MFS transporter
MPLILGKSTKSFSSYFITILGEAPSIFVTILLVDMPLLGRKNSLGIFMFLAGIFHFICY